LVDGPAGIGKTTLLMQARQAASGLPVRLAGATGSELERSFAFGVVRQLLEPLISAEDAKARASLFAGAAAPARSVLETAPGDAEESFSVLHALYWVVLGLAAAHALVLLVDDAQWADRPSLRLLMHLARRLEGTPVAVVAARRTGEAGDESLETLAELPGALRIRLAPLSERGVAALLGTADAARTRAYRQATAGNPFYLRELMRAAAPGAIPERLGPRSIARHVLRRLDRLGPEATRLARAAAVLGDDAPLRHAARLAEAASPGAAARAMLEMEILAAEDPVRFVHPIVARAVYADLTPDVRSAMHVSAARLLSDEAAGPERVAAHLLAVPHVTEGWALDALRSASREALARARRRSACAICATPRRRPRRAARCCTSSGSPRSTPAIRRRWNTSSAPGRSPPTAAGAVRLCSISRGRWRPAAASEKRPR
jgi:predicted ATPase